MNFPSVSQFSIAKGTGGTNPPEMYIPLWWYSGSYSSLTSSYVAYAFRRGTSTPGSLVSNAPVTSDMQLYRVNPSWNPNTQFALEVSGYMSATGNQASVNLVDLSTVGSPAGSSVSGSSLTFTTTSMQVMRTGKFTLTPGKSYGLWIGGWSGSGGGYITDASLIVFPS